MPSYRLVLLHYLIICRINKPQYVLNSADLFIGDIPLFGICPDLCGKNCTATATAATTNEV